MNKNAVRDGFRIETRIEETPCGAMLVAELRPPDSVAAALAPRGVVVNIELARALHAALTEATLKEWLALVCALNDQLLKDSLGFETKTDPATAVPIGRASH